MLLGVAFASVVEAESPATQARHADYVPDEKTAVSIAQAVLISRFGEESVRAELPLSAIKSAGGFWIVQGAAPGAERTGGGMAVWVNANSGCIEGVFTRMK